jgi:hypothetical protein
MIKRFFEIAQEQGIIVAVSKAFRYTPRIVVGSLAKKVFDVNSFEYWNFRMRFNWASAGGSEQTKGFAESFFSHTRLNDSYNMRSILDFGCALGDSAPVFRDFFPKAELLMHDISSAGVKSAVKKYTTLGVKKWDKSTQCELVYCSNVIEHVKKPSVLVDELIRASSKVVCVQCPWEERHANGSRITNDEPLGEHIWTIDDSFVKEFLMDKRFSRTKKIIGECKTGWPGGKQLFFRFS